MAKRDARKRFGENLRERRDDWCSSSLRKPYGVAFTLLGDGMELKQKALKLVREAAGIAA